jgi:beta-lactamase regulating signal transducer with metallopeptidase domain
VALHLPFADGGWSVVASGVLALLLTYTLHAAVWTLAATAPARWAAISSSARCDLWRLAVFAPIATAGLALALPHSAASGPAMPPGPAVRFAWAQETLSLAGGISWHELPLNAFAAVAVVGALGGLVRWLMQALRLARSLRGRALVVDARWLERLERLRLRTRLARVRLTQSALVTSPLVLGMAEICVPVGLLSLGDAELDNVLAHELAHLERRDGVWFPLVGVAATVLWFQPACAWAAARFRESAEHACDDRAVELTRDAVGLARVLLQLASSASARLGGALAPTIANSKQALLSRIRRLTSDEPTVPVSARRHRVRMASLGLAVLGAASLGLSVGVASARGLLPTRAALAAKQAASSSRVRAIEAEQQLRHLLANERWMAEQPFSEAGSWHARAGGEQP